MPPYEQVRERLAARLGPRSLAHSDAVAETAAALAARFGLDVESARLAGLVHDWAREDDRAAMVERARDAGLPVDDADRRAPYLLHAPLAALDLAEAFPGLPPEVLSAVEHHTVGDPSMTDLDRVVWVADVIEPGRTHPGVDRLRALAAHASLDELFREAYAHSVAHLVERRRPIHPRTVAVWNAYVAEAAR